MNRAFRGAIVGCLVSVCGACGLVRESVGPPPGLSADDLKASTTNEIEVVDDLLRRARIVQTVNGKVVAAEPAMGSADWYYIVPAGFSYIDEKCNAYLRALYDLDRNRDRVKNGLLLADKASNAILGATHVSIKAMQITAQAFGAISGGTDIFTDRYEFKTEPAIVYLTVDKLRSQYRSDIYELRDSIVSPNQAMVVLRTYLSICQPHSIEAVVNSYVAKAEPASNVETLKKLIKTGGALSGPDVAALVQQKSVRLAKGSATGLRVGLGR